MEKAVNLNPKDAWSLQNLTFNYQMLRDYQKANKTIDRALALNPSGLEPLEVKAKLAIAENGDFSVAEKAFDAVKSVPMSKEQKLKTTGSRIDLFLLERKYREALEMAESIPDDDLAAFLPHLWSKYFYIGFARKGLHDEAGARAAFLKGKAAAEQQVKRTPDAEESHIQLAKTLAFLGEREAAMAEAQRASELRPESKDAFGGPEVMESVAQVYAILGEKDRAIEVLDGLLSRPSAMTVQTLKVNPIWDPLRNDPGFQALLSKYAGKT
jgi:serine/threonine-protein kinase